MNDEALFLLVTIAGRTVATPAAEVRAVIEIEEITPIPRVAPHVVGLYALRSRVVTVVDARVSLGEAAERRFPAPGVVVRIEGHGYALLFDEVIDVVTARAAPSVAVLGADWARVVTGRITVEEQPVLVVSPAALVAGRERLAA